MPDMLQGSDALFFLAIGLTACQAANDPQEK